MGETEHVGIALRYITEREITQCVDGKALHSERGDDSTVHHRATQSPQSVVPCTGKVPDQARGKGIAGAGRVNHRGDRVGGHKKGALR